MPFVFPLYDTGVFFSHYHSLHQIVRLIFHSQLSTEIYICMAYQNVPTEYMCTAEYKGSDPAYCHYFPLPMASLPSEVPFCEHGVVA